MGVERLVLGTAQLGLSYGVANRRGMLSPEQAEAILERAVELGVDTIDTAAAYGEAETRIGAFLKRHALFETVRICTKLPPLGADLSRDRLHRSVQSALDSSLRRLGVPTVDSYLVHDAADLKRYGADLVDALSRQQERGRIRAIGVSTYSPAESALLENHPSLSLLQHPLSLLDRRLLAGDRLTRLRASGVTVHARSVFLQGLMTLGAAALPNEAREPLHGLQRILDRFDVTAAQAALPFVLASGVDRAVIGVDDVQQLEQNVRAAGEPLPEGLVQALEEELADLPERVLDPRHW